MSKKIIKLSESQFKQLVSEDYPFSYLGNGSTSVNHGSEVTTDIPYNSVNIEVQPTDSDKVSKTLSNNKWWNRCYGQNRYKF